MTWLLWILGIGLVLLLVNGGRQTYQRYSPPAEPSTTVITRTGTGAFVDLLGNVLLIGFVLFLIYGGFNFWHWFGSAGNQINSTVNGFVHH